MEDQNKIESLTEYLKRGKYVSGIKSQNKIVRFTDNTNRARGNNPDGLYILQLDSTGNESHVVILDKQKKKISLFDPNGIKWGKLDFIDNYTVILNNVEVSVGNFSPRDSWNDEGNCAIWLLVVVILFKNFPKSKNKLFRQYMNRDLKGKLNASVWITTAIKPIILNNWSQKRKVLKIVNEIELVISSGNTQQGGGDKKTIVFFTKKGQPYIKNKFGQCRFIPKKHKA